MYRLEVDELPPSLNKFHAGMHWTERKRLVDEWHYRFLKAFEDIDLPKPLPKKAIPYQIQCTQFCRAAVRDDDNAIIGIKLCKDSLKYWGYVKDDDYQTFNDGMTSTRKGRVNKMVILIQ